MTVMFIREKNVNGVTYFALVESYRKDGKVRQRILFSLGRKPSLDSFITDAEKRVAAWRSPSETERMACAMVGIKTEVRLAQEMNRLEQLRRWRAQLKT